MKNFYLLLASVNLIAATGFAQQRIAKAEATNTSFSQLTPKNKGRFQK